MEIFEQKQDPSPRINFSFRKPLRALCGLGARRGVTFVCLTRRYLGVRCDAQYPPAQLRHWVGTLVTSCTSEGSRTILASVSDRHRGLPFSP